MLASVFVGTTVDGFIARTNGDVDFLPEEAEPHGHEELMATVDSLVFGRHTYEFVLKYPPWPYKKPVYVLSSRPLARWPEGARIEHMSGAPQDIAAQLAARGHRHIYVDGGITIQRFLAAGLIDRLIVTRIPVLIGKGIPLFGAVPADTKLRHIATRSFPSGLVQSEYHLRTAAERIAPLWA